MDVFFFRGRVFPDHKPLTVSYRPRFSRFSPLELEPYSFIEVSIRDGGFEVKLEIENYTDHRALLLFQTAWDAAQRLANAAGFISAIPYIVVMDFLERPDGSTKAISLGDVHLRSLSLFNNHNIEAIADLLIADHAVGETIADLLSMLSKTHYAPISYGRVAESVARLVAPGVKKSEMWEKARRELRVTETFLRALTDVSTGPRHGNREPISAPINRRLSEMAWILVNRYIHYRLNGNTLSEDIFPELFDLTEQSQR